jgi:NTP pyrophosphatase (non-canonical NTP hydrolase)
MTIAQFQQRIRDIYFAKDNGRGMDATFVWFVEEVGELARALKRGSAQDQMQEFADVLAWLTTLANIAGVDLEEAARLQYAHGCPKCKQTPCACD